MGWNGSGTFVRIYSWVADKNAGLDINASRMDTDTDDITANGLGNCLTRDGQGSAITDLPMNGHKFTDAGDAAGLDQFATANQLQNNSITFVAGTGTGDNIAATFSPAISTLVDGMVVEVTSPGTNSTTTPQFSPNGLTARTIKKDGGNALAAGDIQNHKRIQLSYVATGTYWELLNPTIPPPTPETDASVPNDGSPHTIFSGSSGALFLHADNGSSSTWSGIVTFQQFASSITPGSVTTQGSPGTWSFSMSGTNLQLTITGGAGGFDTNNIVIIPLA